MIRIAVNGAAGRMGQRILALARESGKFEVVGAFDEKDVIQLSGKGVVIDFSSPEGTLKALEAAQQAGWGIVVGTTGLQVKQLDALKKAGQEIPVVVSSNMSVGVNLVVELLQLLSKKTSDAFDVQITEAHHIHKKDAPSGTALTLLNAIAGVKHWDKQRVDQEKEHIRSIREGEIVGDHNVVFKSREETIEIRHIAHSRDTFAKGALVAAQFLSKKTNGLYSMKDVLGGS